MNAIGKRSKSATSITAVALCAMLSACVTQSTVESKLPDQATKADANQRALIHTERAAEYYRLGNLPIALEAVQAAIEANPKHAPAYNMQGIVYVGLGEDAKAQQAYEKALQLSPNDSETLNNYGWFVCERKSPAKAMPYFEQALKNTLYATPEKALFNTGVCARKMGDVDKAENMLRTTLQRQPAYAPALYELADLRFAGGRAKEAEALLTRYNQLVSNPTLEALFLGSRIARALNDKSGEASYIQQLRRRFPDAPQTRLAQELRAQ